MNKCVMAIIAGLCLSWGSTHTVAHQVPGQNISEEQAKKIVGEKTVKELEKGNEKIEAGEKYITNETREKINSDLNKLNRSKENEANNVFKSANAQSESMEDTQKRLYICVSSSMPEDVIRKYIIATEPVRSKTVFVVKGFIGGIKQFKQTFDWVNKILCSGSPPGSPDCLVASIDINPNIFSEYDVTKVPAVLYLPKGTTPCNCNESNANSNEKAKPAYLSQGDASIQYHLTKMAEKENPHREEIQQFGKLLTKRFDQKN